MISYDIFTPCVSFSQIDDADVYKCREGRLDYMGHLSFAAIAVPMSVILLNAFIGDAMIDIILPGIYAGVIIGGAELYAVSLLAFLLLICGSVGALCYYVLVYRPACDAHNYRKKELKRILYGDTSYLLNSTRNNTTRRSMISYIKRVGTITKRGIQDSITWISCGEVRLRDPRKRAVQRDWCNLNMAPASQGTILSGHRNSGTRTRSLSFSSRNQMHALFLPPIRISAMMTSSTQWKALYLSRQKGLTSDECGLTTALEGPTSNSRSGSSSDRAHTAMSACDQLVVTKQGSRDLLLKRVTPAIVFDPIEVLFRMRSRLAASSNRLPVSVFDEVDADCLFDEYEYALQSFYPDGMALSSDETKEAFELFHLWKNTQHLHTHYEDDGVKEVVLQTVRFHCFEDWFLEELMSLFRNNLSERLVKHTLHCVPVVRKRIMRAASSSPSYLSGKHEWNIDNGRPSWSPSLTHSSSRRSSPRNASMNTSSRKSHTLYFDNIYSTTNSETYDATSHSPSITESNNTHLFMSDSTPSPPVQTHSPYPRDTPSHWLQSSHSPIVWVRSSDVEQHNDDKIDKNYTKNETKDETKDEHKDEYDDENKRDS